jgi:hypothetical protein
MSVPAPVLDRSRWHATVAILAALTLYELLPPRFTIGPLWVAPILVLGVLVPLTIMRVRGAHNTALRGTAIILIAIVNFFNIVSVAFLARDLLGTGWHATGAQLLLAGSQIWFTNVIVFALWYWELDAGGPFPRSLEPSARACASADFLFPQMGADPTRNPWTPADWKPQFLDYFYLAFNTATAFSPTDVMPLSIMAKMLMLLESVVSLVTIALVLARAVNILA